MEGGNQQLPTVLILLPVHLEVMSVQHQGMLGTVKHFGKEFWPNTRASLASPGITLVLHHQEEPPPQVSLRAILQALPSNPTGQRGTYEDGALHFQCELIVIWQLWQAVAPGGSALVPSSSALGESPGRGGGSGCFLGSITAMVHRSLWEGFIWCRGNRSTMDQAGHMGQAP